MARALGDLWSYNAKDDVFAVSPDPDLHVYDVNVLKDRCLVLATDGAWNVVTPDMAVQCVSESEKSNEKHMIDPQVITQNGGSKSISFTHGGHRAGDCHTLATKKGIQITQPTK